MARPSALQLNDRQRQLARHALGLPNTHGRSYRNRFYGAPDHPDWKAMVAAGNAEMQEALSQKPGSTPFFSLTLQGARQALDAGENLCPEDFPD